MVTAKRKHRRPGHPGQDHTYRMIDARPIYKGSDINTLHYSPDFLVLAEGGSTEFIAFGDRMEVLAVRSLPM